MPALIGAISLYWIFFVFVSRKLMLVVLGMVRNSATLLQTVQVVSDAISESWLSVLLAPFVVFLGLHFTSSVVSTVFVSGLVLNLLLIVIQNEWVVRSATRFEEAALEKARRASELRDGTRRYRGTSLRRRQDVPFSLRFVNSPETAVIWKNLLASTRMPLRRQVLIGLLAITAIYLALLLLPLPDWMYGVFLVTGMVLFLFFPMFAGNGYRNDFRTDLTNLELVRSWPTASWRLFIAEIGGPVVQIGLYSALGAGITLVSQLAIDSLGLERMRIFPEWLMQDTVLPPVLVLGWMMLGASPFVLLTGAMCCAMHNLLALNLPGWVPLGRKRQDAAASMGQNLLITVVILLFMAIGIFPSALLLGFTLRIQDLVARDSSLFLGNAPAGTGDLTSDPVPFDCGHCSRRLELEETGPLRGNSFRKLRVSGSRFQVPSSRFQVSKFPKPGTSWAQVWEVNHLTGCCSGEHRECGEARAGSPILPPTTTFNPGRKHDVQSRPATRRLILARIIHRVPKRRVASPRWQGFTREGPAGIVVHYAEEPEWG